MAQSIQLGKNEPMMFRMGAAEKIVIATVMVTRCCR
jgi:hypothetical protein